MREIIKRQRRHGELHRSSRTGWLRAAVLGANDGIISTASLLAGVASAGANLHTILVAGVSGLVAGAMSMAAGEYVSVQSQADTENADLSQERSELKGNPAAERLELAAIYVARGLDPSLAKQVSEQLMTHDALGAHARDELGITEALRARPIQAALTSAASFASGALSTLAVVVLAPEHALVVWLFAVSGVLLASLGVLAAKVGGGNLLKSAGRTTLWGALAMAITAGIGALFGAVG